MYDYLVVGAGLFGSVFAYEATKRGKTCFVIDKRSHIGGTCYTRRVHGINVHQYGAHIFRTDSKAIWEYMNQFAEFNRFTNCPVANYNGQLYSLPFNMNTFYQMFGAQFPIAAEAYLEKDRVPCENPKNLEEYCLATVGKKIYERLVKGYTEKQWNKKCSELPPDILTLPLRFTFDNNYFNERYQGVPIGGYSQIFVKMLEGSTVALGEDFIANREKFEGVAKKIVYTGKIDDFYDKQFGPLEYRSLKFEESVIQFENFQGNAVVNYTSGDVPYTRIIEHKHFEGTQSPFTVYTKEYPADYDGFNEPFYPINTQKNQSLYERYQELSRTDPNVLFGGWCGSYSNDTMDTTVRKALELVNKELGECCV